MTRDELITIANAGYDSDSLATNAIIDYYMDPRGTFGDTLAQFVALELAEVYEDDHSTAKQIACAIGAMKNAQRGLERIIDALRDARPLFTVCEHYNGFSLQHNPSGQTRWLSDGVDVFEDLTPGDPDFRQRWEDEMNAQPNETLEAYFPDLSTEENK
jgi:hypothetical protein